MGRVASMHRLRPGGLATLIAQAGDADAVVAGRLRISHEGLVLSHTAFPAPRRDYPLPDAALETLLWRRRLWDRLGGWRPGFGEWTLWDFLLRALQAGSRIAVVPDFPVACQLAGTTPSIRKEVFALDEEGQAARRANGLPALGIHGAETALLRLRLRTLADRTRWLPAVERDLRATPRRTG